ncbi:MAG: hypothetical protein J2P13_06030 [Acidobacteria bacterium]|nr:hypothetical protein [Acidobacteriota bacterium]
MTTSWSRELLRIASDLPPSWNRAAFQKNALESLSAVDPVGAFRLLPRVDPPEAGDASKIPQDLRAFAAAIIFPRLWDRKGPSTLRSIEAEARAIGVSGEYPYIAMGLISKKLDERKDIDDVRRIFGQALDFYGTGPRVRSANQEFINYLEDEWSDLALTLQEEALRVIVAHLTTKREPDPTVVEVTRVATDKGTVSFQGDSLPLLYRILPKVRQLDPDWAKSLEDDYPELRQPGAAGALQHSSSMTVVNRSGASADKVAHALETGLQSGVLSRLKQQARSDPQQASGLLSSLSEPALQAEALASLATGFAEKDPARAADLLGAAQKAVDNLPNQLTKLKALVSLAQAAVSLHDFERADEIMEKAFGLGEELLSEELDLHPGETVSSSETLDDLTPLAQLGPQISLRSTLLHLDHLKDETLQTYLLIPVAEGLIKAAKPAYPSHQR